MSEISITLVSAAPTPVVTLYQQTGLGPDLTTEPVKIALQAFMKGETGPTGADGASPVISISVHAISANAAPTVEAGGTPLAPTFDIGIPSGASFNVDEFVAQSDGEQIRTYGVAVSASAKVFINGLRQARTEFDVSGSVVTLPDTLSIVRGDLIEIEF